MGENTDSASKTTIYKAIFLMGLVSLLGDTVYEGGRGNIPSFLYYLGASAVVVGAVGGLGELVGYTMRLVGGVLVDLSAKYWFFIFLGYGLIGFIPGLSLTTRIGGWILATLFVILERIGKGVRSPARDTVLANVSKGIGRGKAFGIHEFMDQIGAVAGPSLIALLMAVTNNDYSFSFLFLGIPYVFLMITLYITYKIIGEKSKEGITVKRKKYNFKSVETRSFLYYTFSIFFNTIGLVIASIILYKASVLSKGYEWLPPAIYALIQLIDAPAALMSGILYDRKGVNILVLPFILSMFVAPFLFMSTNVIEVIGVALLYGLVLGMQESIYRAAVADIAPSQYRGTAYGLFNTVLGLAFFLSGVIYGFMLDRKWPIVMVISYSIITQIIALILLRISLRSISEKR